VTYSPDSTFSPEERQHFFLNLSPCSLADLAYKGEAEEKGEGIVFLLWNHWSYRAAVSGKSQHLLVGKRLLTGGVARTNYLW